MDATMHMGANGHLYMETRELQGGRYGYRVQDMGRELNDAFINGDPSATPAPFALPCPFCGGAAFTPVHCPNCGAPKAGH